MKNAPVNCIRTDSNNDDFQRLAGALDAYLRVLDGEEHLFYAQFNKTSHLQHTLIAYQHAVAVGCGALKEYAPGVLEVKRMYVLPELRGQRIASTILAQLEEWAVELGYHTCVLETGKRQPEAIALYKKNNYQVVPNYGQYEQMDNSVCFEKVLKE